MSTGPLTAEERGLIERTIREVNSTVCLAVTAEGVAFRRSQVAALRHALARLEALERATEASALERCGQRGSGGVRAGVPPSGHGGNR